MLRGATTHKARATQARDFTGLIYGKITPTDVDGLIEYQNKGYVFIEAKFGDAEMPYGQRLALERLCDDLQKVKPTLLILAKHNNAVNEEIDFAKCIVDGYRYKNEWHKMKVTVKELIDRFIKRLEGVTA